MARSRGSARPPQPDGVYRCRACGHQITRYAGDPPRWSCSRCAGDVLAVATPAELELRPGTDVDDQVAELGAPAPAGDLVPSTGASTAVSGPRGVGVPPLGGDRRGAEAAAPVSGPHSGSARGPRRRMADVDDHDVVAAPGIARPAAAGDQLTSVDVDLQPTAQLGGGLPAERVTESTSQLISVQARERVERYAAAASSPNTLRAYRHDWSEWTSWCAEHLYTPLPASPAVIAAYVAELADRPGISVATIERRLAAIGRMHREAEIDPPPNRALEVQRVMTGIRRSLGTAPRHQRAPLAVDELRRLLLAVDPATQAGERDRALLLIGYYFAGRRSELVALDVEDLVEVAEGLRIRVRRSKTDQEGAGEIKGIPRKPDPSVCPVVALLGWLEAAAIADGPIWRRVSRWDTVGAERLTAQSVNLIIKRACRRAGIDPSRYAGHSLRAGFSTAAGLAQAPERAIMRQTGHRSERMLRRYIRPASVFVENAGAWVNL